MRIETNISVLYAKSWGAEQALVASATSIPTFDRWMEQIDEVMQRKTGLSYLDLPDCSYADWYDEGITPARAAVRAIKCARDES